MIFKCEEDNLNLKIFPDIIEFLISCMMNGISQHSFEFLIIVIYGKKSATFRW